jgi:hypothetical protein
MKTFILIHVAISLAGIFSGMIVLFGMITGKRLNGWTAIFLATTFATNATGFLFRFERLLPSHVVGAISLLVLAIAIYARYSRGLAGSWRKVYVGTAVAALYFNVFVAVVQAFLKTPALKALAPTQSELPFKIAQAVVFGLFLGLGILAAIRFRAKPEGQPLRAQQVRIPA